ncbi:single-stranded DNA-binding protein [Nocardia vinacea]
MTATAAPEAAPAPLLHNDTTRRGVCVAGTTDQIQTVRTLWTLVKEVYLTLTRGARVLVSGRLKQRSYQTREGEKRSVIELEVEEVGASLRFATVSGVFRNTERRSALNPGPVAESGSSEAEPVPF